MANKNQFFHEIYSKYFSIVAHILQLAQKHGLKRQDIEDIVQREGFLESIITIPDALKTQDWALLLPDMTTPLRCSPKQPLTLLQKRWLKSLLQDERVALFDVDDRGLEDIEPLFTSQQFIYFDRYDDGDDFADEQYRKNFRLILKAIEEKHNLRISYISGKGNNITDIYEPKNLEYSAKDDKFRLKACCNEKVYDLNLGRIIVCELYKNVKPTSGEKQFVKRCKLVVEIIDERSALERAMLHFSHLEKRTERLSADRYRMELTYNKYDETEMVIRILSFGPMLKVIEPTGFIELLRERLSKQLAIINLDEKIK